jgi:hypothetical protein
MYTVQYIPQSRQSAKLFLQLSELGLPKPLTRRRVCPPPPLVLGGGAHSLARKGVGESKFRRGNIHCGTLYICTVLCGIFLSRLKPYRLVPLHSAFLGAVGSGRTAAALLFPLELWASRGRGSRPSPTLCSLTVGLQVKTVTLKLITKCRLLIFFYSCHKVRTYKEYHSVCPSSELGLSQPLSRQRVFPSPQKQGGGGTLACGQGVGGGVPIPTRGIHCGTLYMYVLCDSCIVCESSFRKFTKNSPKRGF